MAEVATVRAQIKAWERSFKDSNGRPPTVDDIKQNPNIAEKYKQYKKLSRTVASSNSTQASKPVASPSTPPKKTRPKDSTTFLLSKSRTVQPPAPLASFNPFSPQKKQKGKEREKSFVSRIDEGSNPFVLPDPTKCVRKGSPDLFPIIQPARLPPAALPSSFELKPLPLPTSAVSRARKRLRGEPVSPSPNKDKRRRLASQTTLQFPPLKLDGPSSDDGEDDFMDAESSFVDNSPVKAPIPGKSYQQLFEETIIPTNLFGVKGIDDAARIKMRIAPFVKGRMKSLHRDIAPKQDTADNLKPPNLRQMTSHSRPHDKEIQESNPGASRNRSSAKRAFPDEEVDTEVALPKPKSPLIPPSPPPAGSNTFFNKGKSKAVAKGNTNRKKVKVDNMDPVDDDSDEPESHELKSKLRILGRNTMRRQHSAKQSDEEVATSDSDPILGYTRFTTPRAASQDDAQLREGNVEIDLPEELRRVLALQSTGSKSQVSEEDRLVKGLLYGRRTNHYDPQKGGEIWDVGEDHHVDESEGNTEAEDDWEGEPVPWEVGEL